MMNQFHRGSGDGLIEEVGRGTVGNWQAKEEVGRETVGRFKSYNKNNHESKKANFIFVHQLINFI